MSLGLLVETYFPIFSPVGHLRRRAFPSSLLDFVHSLSTISSRISRAPTFDTLSSPLLSSPLWLSLTCRWPIPRSPNLRSPRRPSRDLFRLPPIFLQPQSSTLSSRPQPLEALVQRPLLLEIVLGLRGIHRSMRSREGAQESWEDWERQRRREERR